jgi:hypothetical protein
VSGLRKNCSHWIRSFGTLIGMLAFYYYATIVSIPDMVTPSKRAAASDF